MTKLSGKEPITNLIEIGDDWKDFRRQPKWSNSVEGADGCIYGIPHTASRVIRFDPSTKSMTPIGNDLGDNRDKWYCGVLADNGFIYCAPCTANEILKIDTRVNRPRTVSRIGIPPHLRNEADDFFNGKWVSGTKSKNGKLYFMPWTTANHILQIDPKNDAVTVIGHDLGNQDLKYCGTIASPIDECVYGIPYQSKRIIKFDPTKPDEVLVVEETNKQYKCRGGVLGKDGLIYSLSRANGNILKIDVSNDVVSTINFNEVTTNPGWGIPIRGQDDRLYFPPMETSRVLVFNTDTKQASLVGSHYEPSGRNPAQWWDGALASNGMIYCMPRNADHVLEIDSRDAFIPRVIKAVGPLVSLYGVPDRLEYYIYAKALSTVVRSLENRETSLSIALFAPWGRGKRFIYDQILFYHREVAKLKLLAMKAEEKERGKTPSTGEIIRLIFWDSVDFACNVVCSVIEYISCYSETSEEKKDEIVATVMVPTFPVGLVIFVVWFFLCLFGKCAFKLVRCRDPARNGDDRESAMGNPATRWTGVRNILAGKTDIYANKNPDNMQRAQFRIAILSFGQMVYQTIVLPVAYLFTKPYERANDMTYYIPVEFSAWEYSGTDLLWASLLEQLLKAVEKECGHYKVFWHRASISLSKEKDSDDFETKQVKRKMAIRTLIFKEMCTIFVGVIIFVNVYLNLGVRMALFSLFSFLPAIIVSINAAMKILPDIGKQTKIIKEITRVQPLEKYKRPDYSKRTGFIGQVRKEVAYLFDFVRMYHYIDDEFERERPIRLSLLVDDLDRYGTGTVVKVLDAVMLLLSDGPITCCLATDNRFVVANIEDHFGDRILNAGLNGKQYMEKIVELQFYIPDLDTTRKKNYFQNIFDGKELTPLRVYNCVKVLERERIDESLLQPNVTVPKNDNEAIDVLLTVFEKMINRNLFTNYREATFLGSLLREVRICSRRQTLEWQRLQDLCLDFISLGIQLILKKRKTTEHSISNHFGSITSGGSMISQDYASPYDVASGDPLLNPSELDWFNSNSKYFVGKPRKMDRIVNSYVLARLIACENRCDTRSTSDFYKKLLKFTILSEQWPYRIAWLILVVDNLKKEIEIRDLEEEHNYPSIGKSFISLFERIAEGKKEKISFADCQNISLVKVYRYVVRILIHSSDDSASQLQRDGDSQIFEQIMLDDKEAVLKVEDIVLPDQKGCVNTLRPYAFNIQQHLVEKIAAEFENCMLVAQKGGNIDSLASKKDNWFTLCKKRPIFFEIEENKTGEIKTISKKMSAEHNGSTEIERMKTEVTEIISNGTSVEDDASIEIYGNNIEERKTISNKMRTGFDGSIEIIENEIEEIEIPNQMSDEDYGSAEIFSNKMSAENDGSIEIIKNKNGEIETISKRIENNGSSLSK